MRFKSGVAAGALIASAMVAVPFAAGPALAAAHRTSSSCVVNPPGAAGGAYILSATGLPIGTAINISVTAPDGSTTGSPLGSTPDGTFNLNVYPTSGAWTYTFTGPIKHNTDIYATCSITV